MRTPDDYAEIAQAQATLRAYRADVDAFARYCQSVGAAEMFPASPALVAAYLAAHAQIYATATLIRHLAGIGHEHRARGLILNTADPLIRKTLRGIARSHGRPQRQAAALGTREVKAMVRRCGSDLTGIRDAALLLIGFAGGLRRSEIVAIDREHLTLQPQSLRLLIPRSKSDQTGSGAEIVLPYGRDGQTCPVRTLQRWLDVSATRFGPVFRGINRWGRISDDRLHPDGVRRIVLRAAKRAGLTIASHEALSPHGLRAGFITEAYRRGAREADIMQFTRQKSLATMRRYIRRSDKASDNPSGLLGL